MVEISLSGSGEGPRGNPGATLQLCHARRASAGDEPRKLVPLKKYDERRSQPDEGGAASSGRSGAETSKKPNQIVPHGVSRAPQAKETNQGIGPHWLWRGVRGTWLKKME